MIGFHRAMFVTVIASLLTLSDTGSASDWPRFRGHDGSGVASGQTIPAEIGPDRNLLWKVAVDNGTSSPIIVSGKLYLTSHLGTQRLMTCYDAATGAELWKRQMDRHHDEIATAPAGPSTPTAVADTQRVFAFFPDTGLFAWTADGEPLWNRPAEVSRTMHGLSGSLILSGDHVIQVVDQLNDSWIAAYDAATGNPIWKTERVSGLTGGYSTPVLWEPANAPTQIVTTGPFEVVGYDAKTGERLWWVLGKTNAPVSSPILRDNLLYFCEPVGEAIPMSLVGGLDGNKDGRLTPEETAKNPAIARLIVRIDDNWGNKDSVCDEAEWNKAFHSFVGNGGLTCMKPGGKGDVTASSLQWSFGTKVPYIPGVLIDGNTVFTVDDGGIVTTVDATTGKQVKKGRVPKGTKTYYASPVAAGEHVVVIDTEGVVNVLKNQAEWEVVSTSALGEPCFATPAIADNRLYVRTSATLFCFGEPSATAP